MKLTSLAASTVFAMAMFSWGAAPGRAQEHGEGATEAPEAHGEEHPRNALLGIVGGTYESEEKDTFLTIGVEYERIFDPRFAVAFGAEYITEVDAFLVVVPFIYRHPSGWRLLAGPGIELKTRRPHVEREPPENGPGIAEEIVDRPPGKEENLFLWRFGTAYTFEVAEGYAVVPHVDLDFVREDGHWVWALVFSVSLGFDF
jgi:hypothetical protein